MAKKYLSLEEAAAQLGMSKDQLMRCREQGEIRGFADRGSWKFREQDIDEFLRGRQADSSPDLPLILNDAEPAEAGAVDLSASDSDVRLVFGDSDFGDSDAESLESSGSDVRLTGDSGSALDSGEAATISDLSRSDSDVRLPASGSDVKPVGAGTEAELRLGSPRSMSDSDSEVLLADDSELKLSDSDSDVRLSADDDLPLVGTDSDSDVKLMGVDDLLSDDSDSDVKLSAGLDRTNSDIRLAEPHSGPDAKTMAFPAIADDSDLKLISTGSGTKKPQDSGRGNRVTLDADESGISLEVDSGISLGADDSGIGLESFDSGAALGDDSGITLDASDSGISLELDDDSGISLDAADMNSTMPMKTMPMDLFPEEQSMLSESSAMKTQFEIPSPAGMKDSEFELDLDDDDVGTNTSVLTFEDAEEDSASSAAVSAVSDLDLDEEVEEEEEEEEYLEDEGDFEEEYEEDLEDVHDAEDFEDEDFDSGRSQVGAGFGEAAPRVAFRAETDWGMGVKALIGLCAVLSILCAVVGIELVRTMWLWAQPGSESGQSELLKMVGGMF